MQFNPILLQILPPSLLPIDQHHRVADNQPGGSQRRRRFQHRRAAGNEVLDDEAGLVLGENALDGLGGAVVLDFLAAHEHWDLAGDGDAGGDREGRVGDAADDVVGGGPRQGGD